MHWLQSSSETVLLNVGESLSARMALQEVNIFVHTLKSDRSGPNLPNSVILGVRLVYTVDTILIAYIPFASPLHQQPLLRGTEEYESLGNWQGSGC